MQVRPGDRAVARVTGAIAKLARAGCAVVLPLAVGGHIDHRVVRQAGIDAFAKAVFPIGFYEDLPYAARPECAEETEQRVATLQLDAKPELVGAVSADLVARVARKRRVVECYDSQVDSEVAEQIASFCLRYEGRERLWTAGSWQEHFAARAQGGMSA